MRRGLIGKQRARRRGINHDTHTTNTRFVLKSGVEFWCLLSSANKRSPHAVTLSLWHSHSLISHNQTWIIMQPQVRATHCLAAFLKSIRPLSSPLLIYTTACTCVCVRERGRHSPQPVALSFDSWIIHSSDSSSASVCCQFELNYQFRGHRTAALGSGFNTSRYCVVLKPLHLCPAQSMVISSAKMQVKMLVNIFILKKKKRFWINFSVFESLWYLIIFCKVIKIK